MKLSIIKYFFVLAIIGSCCALALAAGITSDTTHLYYPEPSASIDGVHETFYSWIQHKLSIEHCNIMSNDRVLLKVQLDDQCKLHILDIYSTDSALVQYVASQLNNQYCSIPTAPREYLFTLRFRDHI